MAAQKKDGSSTKESPALLSYRLEQVESAVREMGTKLEHMDNLKKTDLFETRDTIIAQFREIRDNLQKQIDEKADQKQVDDLRTLIKAVGAIFSSVITALIIYYLTTSHK